MKQVEISFWPDADKALKLQQAREKPSATIAFAVMSLLPKERAEYDKLDIDERLLYIVDYIDRKVENII